MTVLWYESISASLDTMLQDMYGDEYTSDDLLKKHEGKVIGTRNSFLCGTYLVVACTDDKIRECKIEEATIVTKD